MYTWLLGPRTRARALRTVLGDGQYAITPRTPLRTRAPARVARLQSIYWYRGIRGRYTVTLCWNV